MKYTDDELNIEANSETGSSSESAVMDHSRSRYPYCIVWTPIPILTWLFPFIGHMGIALSSGVIRDFAGPYFVSEDNMAFGKPTKYWKLDPEKTRDGSSSWDPAVQEASEVYSHRIHNLFCDNCHSHVAMALNLMRYDGSDSWNMVKLCYYNLVYSKYVSLWGVMKTWLPFTVIVNAVIIIVTMMKVY